jgi:hypothetical protein
MRILAAVLLLIGAAVAQQCEVLEMTTASSLDSGLSVTQDLGNAKVTTGGISSHNYRVYTVRLDSSIYQIVPQRNWFPRLAVGARVDCRMKKNDIIIRDGYHYAIIGEKAAQ